MALKKCEHCNKRYRFESLHNRECVKRRYALKHPKKEAVQPEAITESAIIDLSGLEAVEIKVVPKKKTLFKTKVKQ